MFNALVLAVAIVAHQGGYYTSLANHLQRWLKQENVSATVTTASGLGAALKNERIAFLVGWEKVTKGEMAQLRGFRQRGGKLVVFYSGAPELAALMGVKVLGFKAAAYPGQWSRMVFASKIPEGLPSAVLQTSSVLMRASPSEGGGGRVIATWSDRRGRSTGDAAWIASPAGFWMTHVLLADGDENLKAQLLGALVGAVEPGKWSLAAHNARQNRANASILAYAKAQVPRKGEIHAVWDHSGCGLYPGNWAKTMQLLKASRVTDLFVNVAGAGFAHYASSVLPRSKIYREEGDQLTACLAAAKGSGIRVHAWILCFSAARSTPDRLEIFRKRGWLQRSATGKTMEYVDPSKAEVREYVLSAIGELQANYAISGVHLDFVRWGDGAAKPKGAAQVVSQFVAEARRRVKRPKWLTAAVYGKYPNCVNTVGQDWRSWLDINIIDYAVPMDYTESSEFYEELLKEHASSAMRARKIIAGIGVTANESRLDARKVIDQIRMTRRFGLAGNSLFDLDTTLEKQILPYLRMGVW